MSFKFFETLNHRRAFVLAAEVAGHDPMVYGLGELLRDWTDQLMEDHPITLGEAWKVIARKRDVFLVEIVLWQREHHDEGLPQKWQHVDATLSSLGDTDAVVANGRKVLRGSENWEVLI